MACGLLRIFLIDEKIEDDSLELASLDAGISVVRLLDVGEHAGSAAAGFDPMVALFTPVKDTLGMDSCRTRMD